MSEESIDQIEELERGKRVAEELLYLVLEHIGEPVELKAEELRTGMRKDRMIDLELDAERDIWVIQTVEVPSEL